MDVVNLLQSRNRCLRRLLESAGDFVAKAEKGDFTGLSAFLERRDSTVRAFELYDRRITALLGALTDEAARQRLIERLRPVLAEREELVHSLLRSDERSFRLIENEKNRISLELAASRKVQGNVMKFKSEWVSGSGEALDQTL